MYIEVEPGLIAVHTQPEDIAMWSASIAALSLKKNEDLTALGHDYVRMLSTKAPKMDWGHLFNPKSFDKNDTPENTKCSGAVVFCLSGFVFQPVMTPDLFISAKRTTFRSIRQLVEWSAKYIAVCAVP